MSELPISEETPKVLKTIGACEENDTARLRILRGAMRRRKPAGGDDETLNQPLLSEDVDSAETPRESSAGGDDDAYPPFDLLGALHELFEWVRLRQ